MVDVISSSAQAVGQEMHNMWIWTYDAICLL